MMAGLTPNARPCLEVPPRCKKNPRIILEGYDGVILLARFVAIDALRPPKAEHGGVAEGRFAGATKQLRNIKLCSTFIPCPSRMRVAGIDRNGRGAFRPAGVNGLVMCCCVLGIDDAEGPRRPRGIRAAMRDHR
jgi:hypothetical protein